MPAVTSTKTNAPTIMIAEKGAGSRAQARGGSRGQVHALESASAGSRAQARGEGDVGGSHDAADSADFAGPGRDGSTRALPAARVRGASHGPPGEANPEYGFVRWGEVELHLSVWTTTPSSRRVAAISMSAMLTRSMPRGRPPMLPAGSGRPRTRRMDCVSLATSIPQGMRRIGSPLRQAGV